MLPVLLLNNLGFSKGYFRFLCLNTPLTQSFLCFLNFIVMATAVDSVKNPYQQLLDDNPSSIFSKGSEQRTRRMLCLPYLQ